MPDKEEDLAHNKKFLLAAFRGIKVTRLCVWNFLELLGFDKNGDGKISMPEFLETMKRSGKVNPRHVMELLEQGDVDGDG